MKFQVEKLFLIQVTAIHTITAEAAPALAAILTLSV